MANFRDEFGKRCFFFFLHLYLFFVRQPAKWSFAKKKGRSSIKFKIIILERFNATCWSINASLKVVLSLKPKYKIQP